MSAAEDRNYDPRRERSIAGLFADLMRETGTLVRTEIELVKTELTEKAGQATGGVVFLVAGGLVALLGVIYLLAAAVLGLAEVMPPWAAALIVGGVVAALGVVLMLMGRNRLRPENLRPQRTAETLRDDKRWAQSQLSR